jgi:antitoxin (DNA-binding transcriptional repressor) of toxin-antitoxin stability system
MRRLKQEASLIGQFESITVSELRQRPGEILTCVELGKTFLITRQGREIAVLSLVPGQTLSITVESDGSLKHHL